MLSLNSEIPVTEDILEKKIGTLLYLENLKKEKENSTEIEPCPICCLVSNCGVCTVIIFMYISYCMLHSIIFFV